MSTRGYISWKIDGTTVYSYNHSDSYPSGLGTDVVKYLNTTTPVQLRADLSSLRLLDELADATPEDIYTYGDHARDVSTGTDNYALLRNLQGDLPGMIAAGVANTCEGPWGDGEYVYEIDLDALTFTVKAHTYSQRHWETLASYPLTALPDSLTD